MKRMTWNALTGDARTAVLARPLPLRAAAVRDAVASIVAEVRAGGDAALRACSERFDGVQISALQVAEIEFAEAEAALAPALKQAIGEAAARIEAFHRAGIEAPVAVETAPGVWVERRSRPIGRVGLYVPAGSAPLPSTALMLGLPARLAACPEIVLCSPPRSDGRCDAAVLYAARLCGVQRVYRLGGAQAIAAMAFGSESVPRCDKLFGPGNAFVTEAKLQVACAPDGAAIDLPAGPSELLVIADGHADPVLVAADLLSQAEHGPDSQVLLVSDSRVLLDAVAGEVERQCGALPRAAIARVALQHARFIFAKSIAQAVDISNHYAPEHLMLAVREPRSWLDAVQNAGSVFLGAWTPESLGDYSSGSNHVLPTGGWARSCSGVSVASFQKQITVQQASIEGLRAIGPCTETLAAAEQLDGHRRAVALRLQKIDASAVA